MAPPSSLTSGGTAADVLLFAFTTLMFVMFHQAKQCTAKPSSSTATTTTTTSAATTCEATVAVAPSLKNAALVFVKPHANTAATQELVQSKLLEAGLSIVSQNDIDGQTIDDKKLIDQHYYAIASKATLLSPRELAVPPATFEQAFGEAWEQVLAEDRAVNAMEACRRFGCTAEELDAAWAKAKQVVKLGGGFYCGLVEPPTTTTTTTTSPLYVFNAFFMSMRSKFVGPGKSIHYYLVEWEPTKLSWKDFRNKLLGPTDPAEAPERSIRRTILDRFAELGLSAQPNKGDNGVHASASPFEGLAERMNWVGVPLEEDAFGQALLQQGVAKETILEWSRDPRVELPGNAGQGSVFDTLEDLDVDDCLAKVVELYQINANLI